MKAIPEGHSTSPDPLPFHRSLSRVSRSGASSPRSCDAVRQVAIPSDVAYLSSLKPMERVKFEWSQRQANRVATSPRAAFGRSVSPHENPFVALKEAAYTKKQEYRLRKAIRHIDCSRGDQKSGPNPYCLWRKTAEERFKYQYFHFNGEYPMFVPTKTLLFRAPGVGAYGGSTSVATEPVIPVEDMKTRRR
jgi:hypothetical protein